MGKLRSDKELMTKKPISPDPNKARNVLADAWSGVISEEPEKTEGFIDRLINSNSVAIRFCLPTQLLGKLTDPKLDCLCLQKGDGISESQWDPRGFATKVVVPWVQENERVLGSSTDPYVSKPLRKPRLEEFPTNVKQSKDWTLLYRILESVEITNKPENTLEVFLSVLRSVRKKLSESIFEYAIPERISLEQTRVLIDRFLSESSGGDRGLSVATALFETFGKLFGIFSQVNRAVINASDQSTGLTSDIECLDQEGTLRLAIEVKERNLTLMDVKGAIQKARKSSITELLFNTPRVNPKDEQAIAEQFSKSWASGTNLYQLSIDELIKVGLSLTGEIGRQDFIENVGKQLNQFNTQPVNRQRWKVLLEEI